MPYLEEFEPVPLLIILLTDIERYCYKLILKKCISLHNLQRPAMHNPTW